MSEVQQVAIHSQSALSGLQQSVREGASLFVRILQNQGGGTYLASFAGGRFLVKSGGALKPGETFRAQVKIADGKLFLLPHKGGGTVSGAKAISVQNFTFQSPEASALLSSFSLPADGVSQKILQFLMQRGARLDSALMKKARRLAAKYAGREIDAAESALLLEQKGFDSDDFLEEIMDLLDGDFQEHESENSNGKNSRDENASEKNSNNENSAGKNANEKKSRDENPRDKNLSGEIASDKNSADENASYKNPRDENSRDKNLSSEIASDKNSTDENASYKNSHDENSHHINSVDKNVSDDFQGNENLNEENLLDEISDNTNSAGKNVRANSAEKKAASNSKKATVLENAELYDEPDLETDSAFFVRHCAEEIKQFFASALAGEFRGGDKNDFALPNPNSDADDFVHGEISKKNFLAFFNHKAANGFSQGNKNWIFLPFEFELNSIRKNGDGVLRGSGVFRICIDVQRNLAEKCSVNFKFAGKNARFVLCFKDKKVCRVLFSFEGGADVPAEDVARFFGDGVEVRAIAPEEFSAFGTEDSPLSSVEGFA